MNIPRHGPVPGHGIPSLPAGEHSSTSGHGAFINKPTVPDYELLRHIGAGAYGEIWLARSTATDALRAAKIVWRHRFDSDRPFQREFEGIQKFERISREHPSQLALFHIGRNEAQGYFYYIMELADPLENPKHELQNPKDVSNTETIHSGDQLQNSSFEVPSGSNLRPSDSFLPHTLRADLSNGRIPVSRVLEIGLALSEALGHLHAHGLVHRDVKPSNVIFVNGRPKLADIGLVTDVGDGRSIVGTEGYLPPEGPGTPQADIFALGKVLFEATTGFSRIEFPQLPPDLRAWPDAKLVFELNEILLKACASDVRQRYQSAEEIRAELMLLRQGQSVRRLHLWEQRIHIFRRIGVAAAAVALLTGGGLFVWRSMGRNSVPLSNRVSADGISGTRSYDAAQFYTSGLTAMRWGTPQGFRQALTNFTAAIKADPQFVAAHARLFEIYLMSEDYDMHTAPPGKAERLSTLSANLVKLAPKSAETHAALAIVHFLNEWKWEEAEEEFKEALTEEPNCRMALTYYGYFLTRQRRTGKAREVLQLALKNDRDSPLITKFLGHCDYVEGKYDRALQLYRETSQKEPSYPSGHYWAGRVNLVLSNYDQALDDFETHELKQGLIPSQLQRGYKDRREALHKQPNQGRGYWLECLNEINDSKDLLPYWYAECHARLGDRAEALAGLKQAVNQRDTVEDLLVDEFWKDYYKEPEFREALKRIGLLRWAP